MTALGKDPVFLKWFWELADEGKDVRIDASADLISYLTNTNTITGKREQPAMPVTKEIMEYAFNRLVKGLASSRECARKGFVACLTELLIVSNITTLQSDNNETIGDNDSNLIEIVNYNAVLKILDDTHKLTGSVRGAEERDVMFGRLFCYIALVRSGSVYILAKGKNVDALDPTTVITERLLDLVDRIMQLHKRKGWAREVCTETLLHLLQSIPLPQKNSAVTKSQSKSWIRAILPKLLELVKAVTLSDICAWQLMLIIGLRITSSAPGYELVKKEIDSSNKEEPILSFVVSKDLEAVQETLLASTAGFPKLHKLWDYLIGDIMGGWTAQGSSQEHQSVVFRLPSVRVKSLSKEQESALSAFVSFLDSHFITGASNEKRCVAMNVVVRLVTLCPAEVLPAAIPQGAIELLRSSRKNKAHTLHNFSAGVLSNLVSAVGDSVQSKLALANIIVLLGGANFDSLTGVPTIESLLAGLDHAAIMSYVKFLCGVIATGKSSRSNPAAEAKETSPDHGVESNASNWDEESNSISSAVAAIEALAALTKNANVERRGLICLTTIAILTRICAFNAGAVNISSACSTTNSVSKSKSSSSRKKSASQKPLVYGTDDEYEKWLILNMESLNNKPQLLDIYGAMDCPLPLPPSTVECIQILETPPTAPSSSDHFFPLALRSAAAQRLPSLLSDMKSTKLSLLSADACERLYGSSKHPEASGDTVGKKRSLPHKDNSASSALDDSTALSTFLLVRLAWSVVAHLTLSSIKPVICIDASSSSEIDMSDAVEEEHWVELTSQINAVFKSQVLIDSVSSASRGPQRLRESLQFLTVLMVFQTLIVPDASVEMLQSLVAIVPSIESTCINADENTSSAGGEGDDSSSSGGNDCLTELLDISMDLLASTPSSSSASSMEPPVGTYSRGIREAVKQVWQAICQCICGKTVRLPVDVIDAVVASVVGDNEDGNIDEEEGDSDDGEASDQDEAMIPRTEPADASVTSDDSGEEDILISPDKAFEMLENSDDEEKGRAPMEHSKEMDGALANMISLRKQSRKEGIMQAHRQQLLMRLRAMDLLEIFIQKIDDGVTLLPLFVPLLQCLQSSYNSTTIQGIPEGVSFTQRLHSIVDNKLCKKKLQLFRTKSDGSAEIDCSQEELASEYEQLWSLLLKMLKSSLPPVRHVAQSCFVSVVRSVWTFYTAITSSNSKSKSKASSGKEIKEMLSNSLQTIQGEVMTKKNSRISMKLLEDIMVNKLSDCAVPILWSGYVSSLTEHSLRIHKECADQNAQNFKISFACNEMLRVLVAVLKKFNGLTDAAQRSVKDCMAGVFAAFNELFEAALSVTSEQNDNPVKASSLKPLLSFLKDLIESVATKIKFTTTSPELQVSYSKLCGKVRDLSDRLGSHHKAEETMTGRDSKKKKSSTGSVGAMVAQLNSIHTKMTAVNSLDPTYSAGSNDKSEATPKEKQKATKAVTEGKKKRKTSKTEAASCIANNNTATGDNTDKKLKKRKRQSI